MLCLRSLFYLFSLIFVIVCIEATKYDMDNSELARVILSRIQKLDPENALKIMGCIFLKEPTNQELVQLALGSDGMLVSRISDAKSILSGSHMQFGSNNHHGSYNSHVPKPDLNLQLVSGQCSSSKDLIVDEYSFDEHTNFRGLKERLEIANQMENDPLPEVSCHGKLTLRTRRRSCSPSKSSKVCHFFNKGYCKHGRSCRFLHEQSLSDGDSWTFIPDMNNAANCDKGVTPRSLEKIEREIVELLRLKGPISTASLPKLYYHCYGKHLLAEEYLTESQRHDTTGFNLIKLVLNFKYSIIVISRSHGEHYIHLAEDAPRYKDTNEITDPGTASSSSHQIYLTFPAESTFTVDDVSNYFSKYGPVKDVRIPCQDKRMFGFVNFVRPESVDAVLMDANPHFIGGARVLAKPYKTKPKTPDRTQTRQIKPMTHDPNLQRNSYFPLMPLDLNNSSQLREQLIGEHDKMFEDDRMCLSKFNMASKTPTQTPLLHYGTEPKTTGYVKFPVVDECYAVDAINTGLNKNDEFSNSCSDHDRSQIELPESPFYSSSRGKQYF